MKHLEDRSTEWLSRRFHAHGKIPNPLETQGPVLHGFYAYFRACAQSLAVMKAYQNPDPSKAPNSIKCRLNLGVTTLIREACDGFGKAYGTCNVDFIASLGVMREVYIGLANEMNGKMLAEKEDIGNAIGFLQVAKVSDLIVLVSS